MRALLIIYDFFLIPVIFLYPFVYLARKKFTLASYLQKLSCIRLSRRGPGATVWIQAVSVGEVLLLKKLIRRLKENRDVNIVISTTTLTGYTVAQKEYGDIADIIFFPFDASFILKRVIRMVEPVLFISVETEIWPHLFYQLYKRAVPIIILNGRISDRAWKRYRRLRFLMRSVLGMCTYIGVQNSFYRERFISLGAPAERTVVSGNMKFDGLCVKDEELEEFRRAWLPQLKSEKEFLLIGASTHHPEERLLLDVYGRLKESFALKLIIAPRHPQRAREIAKHIRQSGYTPVYMSTMGSHVPGADEVYILDTVGHLFSLYGICDVCFVGGTLTSYGGHNILEPIFFSKPTLFGFSMENFRDIEERVLRYDAARKVSDSQELEENLRILLSEPSLREELSRNCKSVFEAEQTYLRNNSRIIEECLQEEPPVPASLRQEAAQSGGVMARSFLVTITKRYLAFIHKKKKNILEKAGWFILYLLSLLYGLAVAGKNFLYDHRFLIPAKISKKVISIGNLSWGGSGKTSAVIRLHRGLTSYMRTAVITKGYARDEYCLLKKALGDVHDAKGRIRLLRSIAHRYDLFILDDGFQYRKLHRDIDIVIMRPQELDVPRYLIPASMHREPLYSLSRAQIVIVTYQNQPSEELKKIIRSYNPAVRIYYGQYKPLTLSDRDNTTVAISSLKGRSCAALTGIGYPEGFLRTMREAGILPSREFIYPDHFYISSGELLKVEDSLRDEGISDVVITRKDYHHIDFSRASLNYYILEVELKIQNEDALITDIRNLLMKRG